MKTISRNLLKQTYMKYKNYLLISIVIFSFLKTIAQPGTIDNTFNPLDSGYWKGNSLNNAITGSVIQPDGKTVVVGYFSRYNDIVTGGIARFNADGTLDQTFKKNGANTNILKVARQSNGKLVIGGLFNAYDGVSRSGIARLNVDGSIDTTFNPGLGLESTLLDNITAIYILADGKIMIGGQFDTYNGVSINHIARILPTGSLDTTFHVGSGADQRPLAFTEQGDGKVVVSFTDGNASYNGVTVGSLARLNTDGTLDGTFKGQFSNKINSILQQDGKLIVAGNHLITRLNADGTTDNSFKTNTGNTGINCLTMQPDKKIIIAGSFSSYNNVPASSVARLDADGNVDNSFNSGNGAGTQATINTVAIQANGQLVLGGDMVSYNGTFRNYIARLNTNGTLDKSVFNVAGSGLNGTIWCNPVQSDGKIIIGGLFTSFNGINLRNIARLNTDGTLDNTFNPGKGTNEWVEDIAIQPDNKIVIGGYFWKYDGTMAHGIARLNSDGSLDNGFKSPFVDTTEIPIIERVLLQPDGKIIIAGYFSINGKNYVVARLLANGQFDPDFKLFASSTYVYSGLCLQPDGKIIVASKFKSFNGTPVNGIIRLNSDGTLDNTFHVATGVNNTIYNATLQNDGKIIITGTFTSFDVTPANHIARLNNDGTLDQTFNAGTGLDKVSWPTSILFQQNNKIILGGSFTSYNGTSANRIIRLNPDGSVDNTFESGTGADGSLTGLSLQKDGKIIISGIFYSYNGTGRNHIARINGDAGVGVPENKMSPVVRVYPNPNAGQFYVSVTEPVEISITDVLGKIIFMKKLHLGEQVIDLTNENDGIYFLNVNSLNTNKSSRIVISK